MPKPPHSATPPEVSDPLAGFHAPVRAWFEQAFPSPTPAQALGWPAIATGEHTLLLAPTGSGKTLAAFLVALERLLFDEVPPKAERCRVLYISPLKALAVDVERNLRAPLDGIAAQARRMDVPVHLPEVAIRTGDTPARERARFQRAPADLLITTPESLFLLLTSNARETLRSVQCVIIDEIHAMVSGKRGVHLSLSLERLQALTHVPFQRIGLSATQRPLDEVARFLGGFEDAADESAEAEVDDLGAGLEAMDAAGESSEYSLARPVRIVDASGPKRLDLRVEMAVADLARSDSPSNQMSGGISPHTGGIWQAIHPLILEQIRSHKSTLVFVNSRRLAERLSMALNQLAGEEIVHAHHGSIAREQRLLIEEELKAGRLPALVATSSLELGIDMGAIDLVIQLESPPSVAAAMQRIGRAGHQVDAASKGIILPKYRGDLPACAAIVERMRAGAVEQMRYPRNALDVLAQQIVAMVSMDDWPVAELERLVRRAAPYRHLPKALLIEVLDMLSGRYPSDDFAELRPRITWDRNAQMLLGREGAKRIAVANAGSIPDRGLFGVFMAGAPKGAGRVGELDEEMVFESRVGDTFLLGASSWRIEEITHDRVVVSPLPGAPGRMPFWHGDTLGRPLEFGRAIGALTRTVRALPKDKAILHLVQENALSSTAARDMLDYLQDQADAAGEVPDDRTILVERTRDEMGDWRICVLSPFGSRVHAPWAMAIGAMARDRHGIEVDIMWSDNGIVARFPDTDAPPATEEMIPSAHDVQNLVIRQLSVGGGGAREAHQGAPVTALFASRFREAAARALLIPRRKPGRRSPLWQQRKRAADLLRVTAKFGSFPIVLETYRECLQDVFEMPALVEILRQIETREVRVATVNSLVPSPFASALLFSYVANFMYEGDAPLAERRAQALTVDPVHLRQLLGDIELRELLDPEAIEEIERSLQRLGEGHGARHADGLHDLLLQLGDLTKAELRDRCAEDPAAWLQSLSKLGRVVEVRVAGEPRWIAAEDAARYRDALGCEIPSGVHEALLEPVRDSLGDLTARYARTHGPFRPREIAGRFGIGEGPVLNVVRSLEADGRVIQGELRPGTTGLDWCDTGVLRSLRSRSLARLRREVEPVSQAALGRLLLDWHGIATHEVGSSIDRDAPKRRSPRQLIEVIAQLQGSPLPASLLESKILPNRIQGYDHRELDSLLSSGQVVWVGAEPIAPRDGRVRLLLAEQAHRLLPRADESSRPQGALHQRIREHLSGRGASFFPLLLQAVGGFPPEVVDALWDLVWAGDVTNDTLLPLREYLNTDRDHKARELSGRGPRHMGRHRPVARTSLLLPTGRQSPPEASGRWSLVSSMVFGEASPTEQISAFTQQLLERHGVLTREAVRAEGMEGGFGAVYPVLKALEEAGRVRRGAFVAGLGATQFGLPGAVDRLRALREPAEPLRGVWLAAVDPANPYGAALPWPVREDSRRPMRAIGSMVALVEGAPVAWLARGEKSLLTFLGALEGRPAETAARAVAWMLCSLVLSGERRGMLIEEIDGAVPSGMMAAALREAGFKSSGTGLLFRG